MNNLSVSDIGGLHENPHNEDMAGALADSAAGRCIGDGTPCRLVAFAYPPELEFAECDKGGTAPEWSQSLQTAGKRFNWGHWGQT